MKPALYYAIRRNLYDTVVAVTSEKGTRRWHGRDCQYNEVTHGTFDQLRGRFETQELAEKCRGSIKQISENFEAARKPLERQIQQLRRQERDAIEAYIKEQSK